MPPMLRHSHALRGCYDSDRVPSSFSFRVRAMSHAYLFFHRGMSYMHSMHALHLLIGLDAMLTSLAHTMLASSSLS